MSEKFQNWKEFEEELNLTPEEEAQIRFEMDLIETEIKIRNEKNLSQKELSEKAKMKQSALARIEKNMHSPSVNTLLRILQPLGYTLKIVPIEDNKSEKS